MNRLIMILLFTCVCATAQAQVNFVKNPGFEEYSECPDGWNEIHYAKNWRNVTDSVMNLGMEYYNTCGNAFLNRNAHIPENTSFYQYPHCGNGMAGAVLFNDKTIWAEKGELPFNYRDNLQGHLFKPLTAGKTYCVSFWVNSAEAAGYVHNKIGAYLDNGAINTIADTPGQEIITVIPQVYSNKILEDTAIWERIEGSFVATGTETRISIGNFFPNTDVTSKVSNYWMAFYTTSYYLIDDVSVIPIDLEADAGPNRWVELGKQVKIGRVGDTTALGLDCKWYHKGSLIDSGAIIEVKAKSISGLIDTYVVVQTICGLVKRDTVTVTTVPLGVKEWAQENVFSVYPNPSEGVITITAKGNDKSAMLKVYDLLGRTIETHSLEFTDQRTNIRLNVTAGIYILELTDEYGISGRERINVQ